MTYRKTNTDFPYLKLMEPLTDEQRDIVAQHMGLVYSTVAKIVRGTNPRFDDMVQAGAIGLMRAVQKFDPSRGVEFSTYAVAWIHAGMHYEYDYDVTVRIPRPVKDMSRKIKRVVKEYRMKYGEWPKNSEIAEAIGVSEKIIEDHNRTVPRSCRSLDAPIFDDSELIYVSVIADRNAVMPDHAIDAREVAAIVSENVSSIRRVRTNTRKPHRCPLLASMGIKKLPTDIREIIVRRHLMEGETMQQVADSYGVTRERIRQIKDEAIEELRPKLEQAL